MGEGRLSMATVTVKSRSPIALAAFWRDLLAYVEVAHPTDSIRLDDPSGAGPTILIQPSSEQNPPSDRIHLDLRPDDHDAAVARALSLGARHVSIGQSGDEPWQVLCDPEGNLFCILHPQR